MNNAHSQLQSQCERIGDFNVLIHIGNVYRWWLGEREKPTIENESKIESESLELDTKDECGVEGGDNQSHGTPACNFRNTQYKNISKVWT